MQYVSHYHFIYSKLKKNSSPRFSRSRTSSLQRKKKGMYKPFSFSLPHHPYTLDTTFNSLSLFYRFIPKPLI